MSIKKALLDNDIPTRTELELMRIISAKEAYLPHSQNPEKMLEFIEQNQQRLEKLQKKLGVKPLAERIAEIDLWD